MSKKPQRWWLPAALLAVITILAYSNSLDLGVALDGRGIIHGDPRIREASLQNLSLILHTDYWWPSSVDRLYRPLTTASFLFNYAVLGNGQDPAGYHWLNLLLHLINMLLVYRLAELVLKSRPAAWFGAAIWAVHPIGTEVVANIAGRADLLSAMAVLGGLLLFAHLRSRPMRRLWVGCAALFAIATAGVLSKENAAVLIGLMLLWDVAFRQPDVYEKGMAKLLPYGAALASLAVMLAARAAVFAEAPWPEMPFVDNPIRAAGFLVGRLTAIKVIGLDLWLLVCPLRLSSDRAFHAIPMAGWSDWRVWATLAVAAAILWTVVKRRRRDPVMFWSVGLFGIALLPTSNLLTVIGSIMAERFLYLPSIGFAVAVAAMAWRLANPRLGRALLVVMLAAFAARTWARNADWRNDETLNASGIAAAPGSFRPHEELAFSLYQADPRGNLDRAIQEGETAWNILRVLPPADIYQQTPAHLGLYYMTKGDAVSAASSGAASGGRAWYLKALAVLEGAREASQAHEHAYDQSQLDHGKPITTRVAFQPLYFILAAVEERLGQNDAAVASARYGLELDPTRPDGFDALAGAYRLMGDGNRATIALDEKVAVMGLSQQTVAELRQAYGPDSCALTQTADQVRLNLDCPRLRQDFCAAWRDLAGVFTAARIPKPIESFRQSEAQNGCPAR